MCLGASFNIYRVECESPIVGLQVFVLPGTMLRYLSYLELPTSQTFEAVGGGARRTGGF